LPKSEIQIELDNPRDCFEILEGEKFRNSRVEFKTHGKRMTVKVVSQNQKALISALGSVIKQIRIIEQTEELLKK
jgi:tRNA threonylcarbamoyladenosine modification (KEOPS) complex  Pcc1 subunit